LKGRYADLGGVEVIQAALGQASGTTRFIFNEGSPEESGIRERHYNDPARAQLTPLRVPLARLDDLCSEWTRLDFVKIDTEGGEVDILLGGQGTLARLRPVLSVEYGASSYLAYGKEQSTLFHLAEQFGYGLHDLFGHPIASLGEWERCSDSFYWDFLMVPRERHDEVERRLSTQWERLWMSLK
jgi:FkbM family methyltransferase